MSVKSKTVFFLATLFVMALDIAFMWFAIGNLYQGQGVFQYFKHNSDETLKYLLFNFLLVLPLPVMALVYKYSAKGILLGYIASLLSTTIYITCFLLTQGRIPGFYYEYFLEPVGTVLYLTQLAISSVVAVTSGVIILFALKRKAEQRKLSLDRN